MSGKLIAHVDSGKQKLGEYLVPEATGRWKPIAHLELVDTLKTRSVPITGSPAKNTPSQTTVLSFSESSTSNLN